MENKRIISGVFWKFAERILAQVVSLLVSIVLARILLPEQYGIISIVLIFIVFADVLATSGFNAALIQKKNAKQIDFDTLFWCSLVVSILVYIVLFFAAPLIASFYNMEELTLVLRIFSLRVIIGSYNSIQHAYVSRHMIFKKFFLSTLFGTILSGVVGILMAVNGFGVWALVAQYLTNTLVDSIVLTFTIKWKPKLEFSKQSAKGLIGYGWKVLAADFLGAFFDQLRSLLVGKFYTAADLAYYDKGRHFPSLVIDNANTSIMTVLFPAMSDKNSSKEEVKNLTQRAIKVISFLVIPLALALSAVARPFILFLLTNKWEDAIIYMQLLSFSAAVGLTSNISLQTIKATGRSDILLKLEFVKKPVYIILLLIGSSISVLAIAITSVMYSFYSTYINSRAMGKIIDYPFKEQLKDMMPNYLIGFFVAGVMFAFSFLDIPYILILLIQGTIGLLLFVACSKIFKLDGYEYIMNVIKKRFKRKNA